MGPLKDSIIRQHTSAYVSIRHISAYVNIRQHTSYVCMRHMSAYVSIRHTSAYVNIEGGATQGFLRKQRGNVRLGACWQNK
jgi:hypothetical protein